MSFNFSVQKISVFGTYGEFSVGVGPSKVSARYLLTKIKPGQQGTWENQLATQMYPWREIFKIDELSFEELIQRDLDDSRVAHDMIPYLLGETGHHARFFPPILAVLVPRREGKTGIAPRYPTSSVAGQVETFGTLFDFEKAMVNGEVSPLGVVRYNPQQTAMVIVDGQHRAMAVLALHRQLNKSWGADAFAPYYSHLDVSPEAVAHIELPVCLIYFPDLNEGNDALKNAGVNLTTVCREIFTVVNKSAKPVSKSRELLLNDEDLAAYMMRRTLSSLKDRNPSNVEAARIYSFAFGDDDGEGASSVMAGKIEYCSAVVIHKMHAATSFALPACFNLLKTSDVTDGRYVRNATRPVELLIGLDDLNFKSLGRRAAKSHSPQTVEEVVKRLGSITDTIVLPLFDGLRPFVAHNTAMRELLEALNDPAHKADLVQSKCRTLLFEGSGTRQVFDDHWERLKDRKKELEDKGENAPGHLTQQLTYCESVNRALASHEEKLKLSRAFKLFGIDGNGFMARDDAVVEKDAKELKARAKNIFDAASTQAFQIGYQMAVLTAVEKIKVEGAAFDERLSDAQFISELYLAGFNTLFAISQTRHKSLTGYVVETRAKAFDVAELGFRGLLAAGNVRELNEKQWEFFRFVVLEVVHSRSAFSQVKSVLEESRWARQTARYLEVLPELLGDVEKVRWGYFESAMRAATNSPDFRREVDLKEAKAASEGADTTRLKIVLEEAVAEKRSEVLEQCKLHLKNSLKHLETAAQIAKRFTAKTDELGVLDAEATEEADVDLDVANELSVVLATEEMLHETPENASIPTSDEESAPGA